MRNLRQLSIESHNLTNLTSTANRTYTNSPISDKKLLILSVTLGIVAILGIVTNSVVVFITKKESRYQGPIEEKKRRSLVSYLIYNLALSDLLGSFLSCPCLIIQQYVFSLQTTTLGCSALRFIAYIFPTLSTQILAVICLERYINLVFPFRNFPIKLKRRIIRFAWVFAAFWSLAISFTVKVKITEVQENFYVRQCVPDLEDPTRKTIYMTSLFFTFILPLIIICMSTTRCAIIVRKFKCEPCEPNPNTNGLTDRKVRSTWLVIWLVVIFGATCFPFIIYQAIKSIHGQSVSHSTDFIIRYICTILVYTNGIINPFMYYKNLKHIREKVKGLFGRSLPLNPSRAKVHTLTFENVTYKPESLLEVPKMMLCEARPDEMQGTSSTSTATLNFSSETPLKPEERSFNHIQLSVLTSPLNTFSNG